MAPWLIWIAMAVLAAVAAVPVLAPLFRERRASDSSDLQSSGAGAHAAAIYRDQLGEVERDLAAGIIAAPEAEAARTEIARRLIKAGGEAAPRVTTSGGALKVAATLVIAMPVAAFALYLLLGSPEYPGQPLASRAVSPATQDIATLIAAVEARLEAASDDGAGWEVIAPIYDRLGRNADAARAYSNAIRILGSTAEREAGLGEAMVRLAGGAVTADARAAFARARDLEPDAPLPRFYLALALQQDGETDAALAAWRALLDSAPPDAEWARVVRVQIAALEAPPAAAPGPSMEDIEAAAELPTEDRQAMIEGMVASLAARLDEEGDDPEGWARLVRSYMVLGRPDDAHEALAQARIALVEDPGGLAAVEAAAREAGIVVP